MTARREPASQPSLFGNAAEEYLFNNFLIVDKYSLLQSLLEDKLPGKLSFTGENLKQALKADWARANKLPGKLSFTGENLKQALKTDWARYDMKIFCEILSHPNLAPKTQVNLAQAIINTLKYDKRSRTYPCLYEAEDSFTAVHYLAANPSLTSNLVFSLVNAGFIVDHFAHHRAISGNVIDEIIQSLTGKEFSKYYELQIVQQVSSNPNLTSTQAKLIIKYVHRHVKNLGHWEYRNVPRDNDYLRYFVDGKWAFNSLIPNSLKSRILVSAACN